MMRHYWTLVFGLLIGCGGAQLPSDQIAKTEAEIKAAQVKLSELHEAGPSEGEPKVELHLKLATDQVAMAQKLIKEKEMDRAKLVLMRAEKDAELALALAMEWEARERAEAQVQEVKSIRERIGEESKE
jgi:hypothetical protein